MQEEVVEALAVELAGETEAEAEKEIEGLQGSRKSKNYTLSSLVGE